MTSALYASTIKLTKDATDAISDIAKYADRRFPGAQELQEAALTNLGWICGIFVLIFTLRYFFTRGGTYYLAKAANRLSADLRIRLYRKLLRLPVGYFGEKRIGATQSVLTNDVNVFQSAVGIIRDSIDGPIKAVAALVTLLLLNWKLALVGLALVPLMVFFIQRNARKMKRAQAQVQEDLANLQAVTQESLQGTRVVKAFGAEQQVALAYEGLVDRTFESQMRAVRIVSTLKPTVELIGAAGLAILLYVCGRFALDGTLGAGDVVAMAFAMDTINQGFKSLANVANTYKGVEAASDRIHREILDVPEGHELAGDRTLSGFDGRIEFQNVTFAYPDGTEALSNVSFTIEPGKSLALVGPSGAGKSTIADLVLRFYEPTSGRILLDGVDIREIEPAWLRKQVGVVPQHTFLFAGTISENLRLGAPEADEAAIEWALKQAHATEFTQELATRPTSELGESGIRLSGGQRQRIAIARALVRRPRILVLDEATSALDAHSEKAVTEALNEVMRGRTTLFIAHRLTTAARADQILVLRKGEVVERGSHGELMAQGGVYAGLFRAFSGGLLD